MLLKQVEIKDRGPLLDQNGHLLQAGYARSLLLDYDRQMVKAPKWRIKEWDYYFIGNDEVGVSLTVADNSFMGLAGVEVYDFNNQDMKSFSKMMPFPMGKLNMPTTSAVGDITYHHKSIQVDMISHDTHKELHCVVPDLGDGRYFELNVDLYYRNDDSMVIATPFPDNRKAFYYNQKINNLEAHGSMQVGDQTYVLDGMFGLLDWGRGVWTYNNTWYWSSASTRLEDGSLFGFNLGYGFGDTSQATENMAFYQGKAYKLGDVDFAPESEDFMDQWHFVSRDGLINMTFEPILLKHEDINLGVIRHHPKQAFGYFEGTIQLSSDQTISVDHVFGFAEKVHNKW